MIALTPTEFSTVASSWIGAFVVVISAFLFALFKLLPLLATLKERIDTLFKLHDKNATAIESQQAQLTYVALNTEPTK